MTNEQKIKFLKKEIESYMSESTDCTLTKIYKYNEISMMRGEIKKLTNKL